MRSGISFTLSTSDRLRLAALVADRNTPQKHVRRARIVLLSADGLGTHAIHACGGRFQDRGLALAGPLRAGGRRWAPSGQDATSAHSAAGAGGGGARGDSDARRTTRRDHALDGRRHEQGCGYQHLVGAADLAGA